MSRSRVVYFLIGCWIATWLAASASFAAQTQPADESVRDAGGVRLAFGTNKFEELHEGYLTLEWNPLEDAAGYEVVDASGSVVYTGVLPMAFLSGLADGQYQYQVHALDASGQIIATSTTPATVTVEHWPMRLVWVLFGVGLCVVVCVATVIISGVFRFPKPEAPAC